VTSFYEQELKMRFGIVCFLLFSSIIAGHLSSEGRAGDGKGEGRIGFFEGREGEGRAGCNCNCRFIQVTMNT